MRGSMSRRSKERAVDPALPGRVISDNPATLDAQRSGVEMSLMSAEASPTATRTSATYAVAGVGSPVADEGRNDAISANVAHPFHGQLLHDDVDDEDENGPLAEPLLTHNRFSKKRSGLSSKAQYEQERYLTALTAVAVDGGDVPLTSVDDLAAAAQVGGDADAQWGSPLECHEPSGEHTPHQGVGDDQLRPTSAIVDMETDAYTARSEKSRGNSAVSGPLASAKLGVGNKQHHQIAQPSQGRKGLLKASRRNLEGEHLWLVRHDVESAHAEFIAFDTLDRFARHAHSLLQAVEDGTVQRDGRPGEGQGISMNETFHEEEDDVDQFGRAPRMAPEAAAVATIPTEDTIRKHNESLAATREQRQVEAPRQLAGPRGQRVDPSRTAPRGLSSGKFSPIRVKRGRMGRSSSSSSRTSSSTSNASTKPSDGDQRASSSSESSCTSNSEHRKRKRSHRRRKHRRHRHRHHRKSTRAKGHRHHHRSGSSRASESSGSSSSDPSASTRSSSKRTSRTGRRSSKSTLSSRSRSSSSSDDDDVVDRTFWIDLQTTSATACRRLLNLFPLHPVTHEQVLHPEATDNIEVFTALNYVFVNLKCRRAQVQSHASPAPQTASHQHRHHHHAAGRLCEVEEINGNCDTFGTDDGGDVIVSAIVFADWIVTIHQAPFVGLDELVLRIKSTFGLEKSLRILGSTTADIRYQPNKSATTHVQPQRQVTLPQGTTGSDPSQLDRVRSYVMDQMEGLRSVDPVATSEVTAFGGAAAQVAPPNGAEATRVHGSNQKRRRRLAAQRLWHHRRVGGADIPLLLTGWTFATLIEFVTESYLPDPIAVLAEADSVDEMVLFVGGATYRGDQSDLLLRIAMLRRKISTLRAALYQKEQFVQQMMMPAIRTTFVSRSSIVIDIYRHIMAQTGHVAERLDAARDVLNQANNNFISTITMHMSHASSRTNLKMQMLTQVSTMFLPLNLVAGLFGMNVEIPFQNDTYTSLTAFTVIVSCMGAWLLLTSTSLLMTLRELRTASKETENAAREQQRAIDAPD